MNKQLLSRQLPYTFNSNQPNAGGSRLQRWLGFLILNRMPEPKDIDIAINAALKQPLLRKVGDDEQGEIESLKVLHNYIMVGGALYYKSPTKGLIQWPAQAFKDSCRQKSTSSLLMYTGFCNEPDFTESYQEVHFNEHGEKFWNAAKPLQWKYEKGDWSYIHYYLETMFGRQDVPEERWLTWWYVALMMQKQKIPVPVLVGRQDSGKSSMMEFIRMIWGDSSVSLLPSNPHTQNHNFDIMGKQFLFMEEIEKGSPALNRWLKDMILSTRLHVNPKGINAYDVDSYAKLVITSNDIDSALFVDKGINRRFWVSTPNQFKKDPKFYEKLRAQIPAFLYYIRYEHKIDPEYVVDPVAYFQPGTFDTSTFKKMQENSVTNDDTDAELVENAITNLINKIDPVAKPQQLYIKPVEFVRYYKFNSRIVKLVMEKMHHRKSGSLAGGNYKFQVVYNTEEPYITSCDNKTRLGGYSFLIPPLEDL